MAEVNLEIPKFEPHEEMEFGFLQAAFANICEELGVQKMTADVIRAVMERLVRESLGRAKPNRRMAYLEQFRELLCSLPDAMRKTPESHRGRFVRLRVQDFRMKDAKGRKNAANSAPPRPGYRKAWVEKDSELWEAEVPDREVDLEPITSVNLAEWRAFMAGESIGQQCRPASQLDPSTVGFIRPLNQAAVLLKGFESLYPVLSKLQDLRSMDVRDELFPDVPKIAFSRWTEGRTPTASDLAVLVAAHRARMTASLGNLSTLRGWLAGARLEKRKSRRP